jgi:hypothetical protein
MRYLAFLLSVFGFSASIYSQNFNWAVGSPGHLTNEIWGSAIDNENNVYICGSLIIGQEYGSNAIIAKLNSSGQLIWQNQPELFFGQSKDMVIDSEGNIIVVGNYYYTSMKIDTFQFQACYHPRIFMAKFDKNGKVLWARDFGSDDYLKSSEINSVDIDEDNNIYITGNFNDNIIFDQVKLNRNKSTQLWENDIYLASFNTNGNIRWAKAAGGYGDDWCYDIEVKNNSLYLAGAVSTREPEFDNLHPSVSNAVNVDFVASYSLEGNVKWVKTGRPIESAYSEMVDLATDSKGNVYAYGHISGKLAFDQDTIENAFQQYGVNVRGGMLVKYDSAGNAIWVKAINNGLNDYSHWVLGAKGRISGNVICDKDDNVFLVSSFVDSIQLDQYTLHSNAGTIYGNSRDAYIIKYNEIGYPQWFRQTGGDNNVFVTTSGLNQQGHIIMGGNYNCSSLIFDNSSLVNNSGDNIFFIAELTDISENICPEIKAQIISGQDYICRGDSIQIRCSAHYGNTFSLYTDEDLIKNSYDDKFYVRDAGPYKLVVNSGLVCSDTTIDSYFEVRNKPVSLIGCFPDSILCTGDTAKLEIQQGIDCEYKWYMNGELLPSQSANSIESGIPGIYSSFVDDGYCQSSGTTQIISGMPKVGLDKSGDLNLCPDEQITLKTFQGTGYAFAWYHNDTIVNNQSYMLTALLPGKYRVDVYNSNCVDADSVLITSSPNPFVELFKDTLTTENLPLEILPAGDSLFSYRWHFNNDHEALSSNFGIVAGEYGKYTVVAYNQCGHVQDAVTIVDGNVTGTRGHDVSPDINLYPNPTHGALKINTGNFRVRSVIIYNPAGITISRMEFPAGTVGFDMDLTREKKGIYYIQFNSDEDSIVEKIIVD